MFRTHSNVNAKISITLIIKQIIKVKLFVIKGEPGNGSYSHISKRAFTE